MYTRRNAYRLPLCLAVVATFCVTARLSSQGADQPGASSTSPTAVGGAVRDTPVPVILYGEDIVAFIDEPNEHLMKARAALAGRDTLRAADEVSAAAAFLQIDAAAAQGANKAALEDAARDLQRLSADVRRGAVRTPRALDNALVFTDRTLARHHLERAMRAWEHRETVKAGRELRGAARYTERLAKDAGRGVERGTADVVDGARLVSRKLIDDAGWSAAEVGKGFQALGREIHRLGAKTAPPA